VNELIKQKHSIEWKSSV